MPEEPKPGMAVDSAGGPVVDPTKNVLDLVAAAITRQDDARADLLKLFRAELSEIRSVAETKFDAIKEELRRTEESRVEQKVDTKVAVDAALSAAEKAVKEQAASSEKAILKAETSAAEQSKLNAATFKSDLAAVIQSLQDVKDRVGRIENVRQGGENVRERQRLDLGVVLGLLGALMAGAMLLVVLLR